MTSMIGTAGWSIASRDRAAFPAEGSALERYARVLRAVEINSSFYRSHRASTWARWAASVPERFRFAVKVPKTITHEAKLVATDPLIESFAHEVTPLGEKLAVLLVQLPPKLTLDAEVATRFFDTLRRATGAHIACEPRNASWFTAEAGILLEALQVARVAADSAIAPAAAVPGGWRGLSYWRLHGSPAMYRSSYTEENLEKYAAALHDAIGDGSDVWCMFDNTAASAATGNALSLMAKLDAIAARHPQPSPSLQSRARQRADRADNYPDAKA
jgi:uncharacterized protein YecE (DUF72 family)